MKSISDQVWARIRSSRRKLHSARDFADLGSRAAVDQALSRLARKGRLERPARGLYARRAALPRAPDIAEAVGRTTGRVVVPSGAAAARRFGLTTAEVTREEFLTDGASRDLPLDGRRVRLRHAGRRELAGPPGRVGDALRALQWLGPEMSDGKAVETLRQVLSPAERRSLAKHAAGSQWLRRIASLVASDAAPERPQDVGVLRRKAALVDRWLTPSGRRPEFDIPRFWSNRSLADADTIVALTMAKPTVPDLARSILAYGAGAHVAALETLQRDGELSRRQAAAAAAQLDAALKGVDDARRQLASA